ncbi:DUF3325 domain-containing protein [Stenotrophomonas sepilia]|uniref:DUF3325 domain-containing protein n=1 Tax=Stenotrophomonas sepilia TaxID=2860290 RepID=UPI002E76945C|nr:DUF3325 domain-containing protein [Stenotrophomonas sepilia]
MMLQALALSFSAFTALSLSMEKHQHDLHGKAAAAPARRMQWRVLGWALLAAAFALCVADQGWAMGPVLWLGAMTLAGVTLSLGLYPYRPTWIAPLAIALPVLGLVLELL